MYSAFVVLIMHIFRDKGDIQQHPGVKPSNFHFKQITYLCRPIAFSIAALYVFQIELLAGAAV